MDGLLALAAAKRSAGSLARYKTKFRWCPGVLNGAASQLTGIEETNFFTAGEKYHFFKGGTIYLGEQTVKTMTAHECTGLSTVLSTLFGSTITVFSGTYITDAVNFLNIFAQDETKEAKSVLCTVVLGSGNSLLFADASATARTTGNEDLILKQKADAVEITAAVSEMLFDGSCETTSETGFYMDEDWADYSLFGMTVTDSQNYSVKYVGTLDLTEALPQIIFKSSNSSFAIGAQGDLNRFAVKSSSISEFTGTVYIKRLWGVM